jgi:hypothetical protein
MAENLVRPMSLYIKETIHIINAFKEYFHLNNYCYIQAREICFLFGFMT